MDRSGRKGPGGNRSEELENNCQEQEKVEKNLLPSHGPSSVVELSKYIVVLLLFLHTPPVQTI